MQVRIKANEVDTLTLFVGVGGTGSKIVKKVAEMCRPGETNNVNFVCLDTNANDLSYIESNNKIKIYSVQTSTTQTVGDYLNYDSDALHNWFPKNAVMYDKNVSVGAGQVRAISRLALNSAIKTGKLNPLHDAIDDLFRKDGRKLKTYFRVALVSTASGGTGSGIVLPLSMYIRDYINSKYPLTAPWIRTMLLLPETLDSVIESHIEKESQRRNAYATVKEINAFMMKGSGFCNIEGPLDRYSNLHIEVPVPGTGVLKPLALLPCDFCFLFDGQNSEDNTMVNLDQYIEQAAHALYEQNIGPMQLDSGSIEDNIIKEIADDRDKSGNEEDLDKSPYISKPITGNRGRSRFGGIGASILRYPYESVVEYIAYAWACNNITGETGSVNWGMYDKEYEIKKAEARRRGLPKENTPTRERVYIDSLISGKDNFSTDLRYQFVGDNYSETLDNYILSFENEIVRFVESANSVVNAINGVSHLASAINYADDTNRGKARSNLGYLRTYLDAVERTAASTSRTASEAIFRNARHPQEEKDPFTLEAYLKNNLSEFCHPNAARFYLYLLQMEIAEKIPALEAERNSARQSLEMYSPQAVQPSVYDWSKTKGNEEKNIDEFCGVEAGLNGKYVEEYYSKLNGFFTGYYFAIKEYSDKSALLEAYKIAIDYIRDLSAGFEKFYKTFDEKASALHRRMEDLADGLRFKKGDSIMNVCASRPILDEFVRTTSALSDFGAMLNSELNAAIYVAVRDNAAFERATRNMPVVEEDLRKDVFDDIILGYFKKTVTETCELIKLNIIEAIAMELRINRRLSAREALDEESRGEQEYDSITPKEFESYIKEKLGVGLRLAAPGIQSITNEEPRGIKCCAYHRSLSDMRAYRVNELFSISSQRPVDSISPYEVHFFHAMYNITPDKLKKFAAEITTETGKKAAGLYHNAYMSYSKSIGPDSTKNAMISTHIDKRWDSIAVMPELDFVYLSDQMMRIHQAMVYALVHRAIRLRKISPTASDKQVYRYENTDERFVDLVVSNGTKCDEFYEILDSLYIDAAVVDNIEKLKKKRRRKNEISNSNYDKTVFYSDLEQFTLSNKHDGIASLFEIPLVYYNSLPNSMRYDSEISALIDAVIKTFEDEIKRWEKLEDVPFLLCNELEKHFKLLLNNYVEHEPLHKGTQPQDNPVLDMVYRKIKNVFNCDPEPDCMDERLKEMKALLGNELKIDQSSQSSVN
ncbi:MAG: hypothetical protein IKI64_00340 [Clostridia bacterium]|nr:hypothetical protein [Clostridia bacterium]